MSGNHPKKPLQDEMKTPDNEEPGIMDDVPADEEDDDEALDMDEFEESGMLDLVDPAIATTVKKSDKPEASKSEGATASFDTQDSVLHTRTYDLHITYDKYYQTPRLWVVGYDEVSS